MLPLIPGVQSYDWGKPGSSKDCLVADFAAATPQLGFRRDAEKPYAELWMGTHPNVPSHVADGEKPTLHSVLMSHPELLGDGIVRHFGLDPKRGALPFLFKVLSINKALSIQAHPDKELAERLNAEKPSMYKDANHKPEMAIALTPFEGFCGFRPVREISDFATHVPELARILALDDHGRFMLQAAADEQDRHWAAGDVSKSALVHDALQHVFSRLMRADKDAYESAVSQIATRYNQALCSQKTLEVSAELAQLVVRLNEQFPCDIGVLCTFFLNVVHLKPGQSMFLAANEPHAYLDGNILECMAASDNVVRAGLTPKARDVDVLVHMLTYQSARASDQLLKPQIWNLDASGATQLYQPPISEFAVLLTTLDAGAESKHKGIDGPSILLIVEGSGNMSSNGKAPQQITAGLVWFVGAHADVTLAAKERLVVARAFVAV